MKLRASKKSKKAHNTIQVAFKHVSTVQGLRFKLFVKQSPQHHRALS